LHIMAHKCFTRIIIGSAAQLEPEASLWPLLYKGKDHRVVYQRAVEYLESLPSSLRDLDDLDGDGAPLPASLKRVMERKVRNKEKAGDGASGAAVRAKWL
jgi:hypothetical protein